jgi:4-amino-4-deoxy-L-arabinose transferase-like glycosyltransferase
VSVEKIFISRKILLIWWISLVVKLVIGALIPLAADESYYWVWSQNLQLSYFDHPPMIAWLLKLGSQFSHLGSAVRWPGIFLGHLTLLIWIQILKDYTDFKKIEIWIWLALFSPLLGFGSLIMTPDVPVVFFWSLSLLIFRSLLQKNSNIASMALGLSLGFGFCSKYHIVIFLPVAFAYLTIEKKWRSFSPRSISLIIIFGLIGSFPVLWWNFQNQFSSFKFQLNHGLGRSSWNPFWTYSYPIGQFLLIFPIPLWLAFKSIKNKSHVLLQYFSWGPLLFFFVSSFRGVVEMNWPIIAYPSLYALGALETKSTKLIRWTVGIWISCFLLLISQVITPWIPNAPEKLLELSYFEPTISAAEKYSPLYAESYQMASYLWFKTKKPSFKLYQMSRRDFFDELPGSMPKGYPFYLVMDRNAGLPQWLVEEKPTLEVVEELSPVFIVQKVSKDE